MAQDYKWKFFYNSAKHNIDDVIAFAEEEIIKEESLEDLKGDFSHVISHLEENMKIPSLFFEDKGIIYALADNVYLHGKINKKQ